MIEHFSPLNSTEFKPLGSGTFDDRCPACDHDLSEEFDQQRPENHLEYNEEGGLRYFFYIRCNNCDRLVRNLYDLVHVRAEFTSKGQD